MMIEKTEKEIIETSPEPAPANIIEFQQVEETDLLGFNEPENELPEPQIAPAQPVQEAVPLLDLDLIQPAAPLVSEKVPDKRRSELKEGSQENNYSDVNDLSFINQEEEESEESKTRTEEPREELGIEQEGDEIKVRIPHKKKFEEKELGDINVNLSEHDKNIQAPSTAHHTNNSMSNIGDLTETEKN